MDRKKYTDEFTREAVRLAKERGNLAQVARDLGIHDTLLQRWKKRLETSPARPFPGNGNPRDEEMAQIKRELTRVKQDSHLRSKWAGENEILKKAVGIFTVRPQ